MRTRPTVRSPPMLLPMLLPLLLPPLLIGAAPVAGGHAPPAVWPGRRTPGASGLLPPGPRSIVGAFAVRRSDRPRRTASRRSDPRGGVGVSLSMAPGGIPSVASVASSAASSALTSGPHALGLAALSAVSASVVVPLALVRQAYSFGLGYGLSVAAMSLSMLLAFGAPLRGDPSSAAALACLTLAYGLRLGLFLLWRELTVPSKAEQVRDLDTSSRAARVPLAAAAGVFYALMVSPVLSALRGRAGAIAAGSGAPSAGGPLASLPCLARRSGAAVAALGLAVEAAADLHKSAVKARRSAAGAAAEFVGPTGGLYQLCRHPNYLGEVLFWSGVYLGGLPSFGRSIAAWAAGTTGLYGIVSIMTSATRRLDEWQEDRYDGQVEYAMWRDEVPGTLLPSASAGALWSLLLGIFTFEQDIPPVGRSSF